MNLKPGVHIDHWAMQIGGSITPYAAPETYRYVLHGVVRDHPEHHEGKHVITSTIENLDVEAGRCETRNIIYILGTPLPDYVDHCRRVGSEAVEALEALTA